MQIIISTVAAILTILIIDSVWLKVMFTHLYNPQIGHLLAETPKLLPAGFFYIIYSVALSILVILPALSQNYSLSKVFLLGGLFGMVCYATYDLTNHATLRGWPVIVTIIDIVWGALLTGTVALVAFSITKYFS